MKETIFWNDPKGIFKRPSLRLPVEAPHQRLAYARHGQHVEANLLQFVQHQAGRLVHIVLWTEEAQTWTLLPSLGDFTNSGMLLIVLVLFHFLPRLGLNLASNGNTSMTCVVTWSSKGFLKCVTAVWSRLFLRNSSAVFLCAVKALTNYLPHLL